MTQTLSTIRPLIPPVPPEGAPAARDPHPTLSALARTHLGGDVPALIRLLDALDIGTLRQARIERHHAPGLGRAAQP
ncbi:hypothetical protein [Deinococcus daejeonensis]|uniref:Uncharacterized protein n=1 Tax=Deinococcus daejeonensis TaxID=1007098 RepID=A0ABQ2JFZ8_9DEIO|nr:hypothetical protein [Deinococcus daejeonensis]GGN46796.1 hypothetical protein GCM10010842_37690 [Deinococcus daejeonensis]